MPQYNLLLSTLYLADTTCFATRTDMCLPYTLWWRKKRSRKASKTWRQIIVGQTRRQPVCGKEIVKYERMQCDVWVNQIFLSYSRYFERLYPTESAQINAKLLRNYKLIKGCALQTLLNKSHAYSSTSF